MSTHNDEWLQAFARAMGDKTGDIRFIRIERRSGGHCAVQFDGEDLKAGLEMGSEVR
jgi:hypothetical protein